jgi:hypothetical protein
MGTIAKKVHLTYEVEVEVKVYLEDPRFDNIDEEEAWTVGVANTLALLKTFAPEVQGDGTSLTELAELVSVQSAEVQVFDVDQIDFRIDEL